jgi:prephenate dehydrogenase
MRIATLAIVGVGLIGGSIALAARRRGIANRIIGVDQNHETSNLGRKMGLVDEVASDLAPAVAHADFVVFCTPVDCIAGQVAEAARHCRRGTVLTDVGSAKARIVAQIEAELVPGTAAFVGSHPLAGSEQQGPIHADANLFADRVVVVTPTPHTDPNASVQTVAFWRALGASVCQMSPRAHDDALGLTSHLPHLVAAALAGILPPEWRELTASSFRDSTRVAASNPALWTSILRMNSDAVLAALALFTSQVEQFRDAIASDNAAKLLALLDKGKTMKDDLS